MPEKVPNNSWKWQIDSKAFNFAQQLDRTVQLAVCIEVEGIPPITASAVGIGLARLDPCSQLANGLLMLLTTKVK